MAVAGGGVVWAAASGSWGGVTGQGRAFTLTVDSTGNTISQFSFNIMTPCQSRLESAGPAQINGNLIAYDSGLSNSCRVQIDGAFTSPSTAAGTLTFTPLNAVGCGCPGVQGAPSLYPPVVTNWSVNQGCSYTKSASTFNANISATTGSVNVTTEPACQWTALSESSFVAVTGGASQTGSGSVAFSVAANTDLPGFMTSPRTGRILIAGQPFDIAQPGCTFAVAPSGATYGSAGGVGAVDISAPSACSWDIANLPPWTSTTSGGMANGDGTWEYSVSPNAGATRSQFALVAGHPFRLTQLATPLRTKGPGTSHAFTLADATDENWSSLEAVAGRSYCGELAPARTAVDGADPVLTAYRADATTLLGGDTTVTPRICFIAPADEPALFKVRQTSPGPRTYRLTATETTLWTNWFYIGGDYASFTLLRNTTGDPVHAAITWRTDAGSVASATTATLPAGGVVYYNARDMAPTAVAGSVEVAHDGRPQAIVGSQTTLSPIAGLSFDAVMASRNSQ